MVAEIQDLDVETRKLASFRTVDRIEPIDGADAIELAVVGGWKVVTKKGEFKAGDPCVYFEIDSFLPDGVSAWQFLVDKSSRIFNGVKGHKLRTIKLRGQISQGLILPISAFPILGLVLKPELTALEIEQLRVSDPALQEEVESLRYGLHEFEAELSPQDLNLNKLLGVTKWEAALAPCLAGQAAGLFPSFIRKTDQERAQNLAAEIFGFEDHLVPFDVGNIPTDALVAMQERGDVEFVGDGLGGKWMKVLKAKGDPDAKYEITMKLDGSSCTVFARTVPTGDESLVQIESGVCSRNLQLKVNAENAENTFVKVAVTSGLLGALEELARDHDLSYAVQGELMGPGIQGNREELKDHELFVFDIIDIKAGEKLPPDERHAVFDALVAKGVKIKHVPVIARSANLLDTLGITTMEQLLKFADGPSLKHSIREGLVFKRLDGAFSFKVISNLFLSKEKD